MLTKKQRWFLAVLLLALAVRVAFVWLRPSTLDYPDERSYNTVAENFLDGRGFVLSERLRVHRTPGYPIMLAAVYSIAGRGNLPAVGLVQAALGTLTVALTAALAIALFGPQAALAAAAVAALYPFHLYMTPLLLTETLFTLLLLLYTAAVVKLTAPQSADCLGWALVAGLAGGAAIMTKPSILPLIPATAVLVALIARPRKTAITASVLLLVLSTAVVLPWTVRNHRLTGHFVLTTLWTGKSLYEAVGPQADGGPAMDRITLDEPPNAAEYDFNQYYLKHARSQMAQHPRRMLRLAAAKFVRFWNIFPNSTQHRSTPLKIISAVFVLPLIALALIGIGRNAGHWRRLWPLAIAPVFFTCLHMVFVASVRYRTPVMPMVIVLAAGGLWPRRDKT